MAVIAEDDFTGAGETTLSGRTPTGTTPGTGWSAASGSLTGWIVESGVVRSVNGGWTHQVARLAAASYSADYEVSATMAFGGSVSGVACWGLRIRQGASGLSGYGVVYQGWVDQWVLHKGDFDVDGSVLDAWSDTPDGNTRTVRLKAEGTKIEVYINDVLRLEATDSTYSDAGQPALHAFGDGSSDVDDVEFDNLQALSLTPTGTEHSPADLGVAGSLQAASLTQDHVLSPTSLGVAAGLESTGITQAGELAPAPLAVAASLEGATLTQSHVLSPADLAVSVALETTGVTDEAPPQTLAGDDFTSGSEDDDLGGRTPSGPNVGDATTWEAIMGPAGGFQKTDGDSIAYRAASYNPVLQVLNRTGGYPDDGQASIDVQFQDALVAYAIGVVMRVGASGYATGYCLVVYHTILFEGVRLMRGQGLSTWEWDVLDEWAVAHPEDETWNLRLEIEGESLSGYVNDVLRVSAMDDEYTSGRSGVVGLSDENHYGAGVHLTDFLAETLASAETILSPADLGVAAGLDGTTLAQNHILAPDSLDVTAGLDAATAAQSHQLSPADMSVAGSVEGSSISQNDILSPADLSVAAALAATDATQGHALAPSGLSVAPSIEAAALSQDHVLTPAGLSVAANLGATSVAQAGELAPADLSASTTLEATTISQAHVLAPADLAVAAGLDASGIAQAGELSPADTAVAASLDGATITQNHVLAPAGLSVTAAVEGAELMLAGELTPVDLTIAALLEEVALSQVHALFPADLGIGSALDGTGVVTDAYSLSPAGMGVGVALEEAGATQIHALSAADLAVSASLDVSALRFATPPYRATVRLDPLFGAVSTLEPMFGATATLEPD